MRPHAIQLESGITRSPFFTRLAREPCSGTFCFTRADAQGCAVSQDRGEGTLAEGRTRHQVHLILDRAARALVSRRTLLRAAMTSAGTLAIPGSTRRQPMCSLFVSLI